MWIEPAALSAARLVDDFVLAVLAGHGNINSCGNDIAGADGATSPGKVPNRPRKLTDAIMFRSACGFSDDPQLATELSVAE